MVEPERERPGNTAAAPLRDADANGVCRVELRAAANLADFTILTRKVMYLCTLGSTDAEEQQGACHEERKALDPNRRIRSPQLRNIF